MVLRVLFLQEATLGLESKILQICQAALWHVQRSQEELFVVRIRSGLLRSEERLKVGDVLVQLLVGLRLYCDCDLQRVLRVLEILYLRRGRRDLRGGLTEDLDERLGVPQAHSRSGLLHLKVVVNVDFSFAQFLDLGLNRVDLAIVEGKLLHLVNDDAEIDTVLFDFFILVSAEEYEFRVLLASASLHLNEGLHIEELVQTYDKVTLTDIEAFLDDIRRYQYVDASLTELGQDIS